MNTMIAPAGPEKLEKRRPGLISHPLFTKANWGPHHPLGAGRHRNVMELCAHLGWIDPINLLPVEPADFSTLARHHNEDYIRAFQSASRAGRVARADREKYLFGTMENPIFDSAFERAAATVSGSILAAEKALEGQIVFHPAGGTHHGKADRAAGFCYFNDPAFAISTFLDAGAKPVLYMDLDAHHGDGVELMFASNPDVFMVSVHEENRWPHTGAVADRAGGNARNISVPRGFHDAELRFVLDEVILPHIERLKPQAVVMTCGADGLHGDPLSAMELSNVALWDAIVEIASRVPAAVVLGGGGYNPWTVARFWSGLWGRLAGHASAPVPLPQPAQDLLKALSSDLVDEDEIEPHWLSQLEDDPQPPAPVRDEIRQITAEIMVD